jgi:hypothetical protein
MLLGNLSIFDATQFRRDSRDLHLLSRGNFDPVRDALAREFPNTDLPVRAVPFVEKYITTMTGQYSAGVVRRFTPNTLTVEQFGKLQQVYVDSGIDLTLAQVEADLWIQNTIFLIPLPAGLGRVRWQPILPWQAEATTPDALLADDPQTWDRFECQIPTTAVADQVLFGRITITRTEAWREIGGKRVGIFRADGSHPFGVVPVVAIHRIAPDLGRYCAPVNETVLNLAVSLCTQEADTEHIIRHCAWPQKVIENADMGQMVEDTALGPDRVYSLVKQDPTSAAGPTLKIVQGQVPVAEFASHAEHKIRLYCSMLGLDSSDFLRTNTSTTAEARRFNDAKRNDLRNRIRPVLERAEQLLVRWTAKVLSLTELVPFPIDQLGVQVTWPEVSIATDPVAEATAVQQQIALGLTTASEVLADQEGVSRSEGLRLVKRNLAETAKLAPTTVDPTAPTDAATPDTATPAPDAVIADTALNGAQVQALVGIVQQVTLGQLPASAAEQMILLTFPSLDPASVRGMVQAAASFTPDPQGQGQVPQ